ncbi:target of Nesh-SH3-like isoform X4 [Anguilla anguilla]|uniref:target of Nesh-SH3-like isoform X4 n=1 Tax=Anguilla anguilla TaxID=7936 RepID=UPI0015AA4DCF|nr:target of Nesh-SH3-like isoform X4 [Anguilla anguilla]
MLIRPLLPLLLLLAAVVLVSCNSARKIRVRRQNMKVRINATEDTIILKFVRPNPDIKLEGYILGYGSSMFSKQFIKLPDNGEPYETEIDAEPKYLVAVQPVPSNDVKKQCKERYFLEKPLHLVVGTVTPTSVLLSWGALVKTSYEGNILRDCLDDGNFTVRYREMNRRWNYQTCPTSDTVIDHLKPDTPYEFSVRPNQVARKVWSKTVVHNTFMDDKPKQNPIIPKVINTKPGKPVPHGPQSPPINIHNSPQTKVFPVPKKPGPAATKSPPAPPKSRPEIPPVVKDRTPQSPLSPLGKREPKKTTTSSPNVPRSVAVTVPTHKPTSGKVSSPSTSYGMRPYSSPSVPEPSHTSGPDDDGEHHKGFKLPKPVIEPTIPMGSPSEPLPSPIRNVDMKGKHTDKDVGNVTKPQFLPDEVTKEMNRASTPKPRLLHVTVAPIKQEPQLTTASPTLKSQKASQTLKDQTATPTLKDQTATPTLKDQTATPTLKDQTATPSPDSETATSTPDSQTVTPTLNGQTTTPTVKSQTTTPTLKVQTTKPTLKVQTTKPTLKVQTTKPTLKVQTTKPTLKARKTIPTPKGRTTTTTPKVQTTKHTLKARKTIPTPKGRTTTTTPKVQTTKPTLKVQTTKPTLKARKTAPTPKGRTTTPTPKRQTTTPKLKSQTTPPTLDDRTSMPTLNDSRDNLWDNTSVFSPVPSSDVDAMGKKRFTAPHVVYKTDKKPEEPCSITESLKYFPMEEGGDLNVTAPPRFPPSNLTVVTVEGCPSFIILDWEKGDNETTDYEVTARVPNGKTSIMNTNQTHAALENLTPNSSYEFRVKPFNELGEGPSTDPVVFDTESADPRVSEYTAGRAAIWTPFSFNADEYSECRGKQYVKRTWYRKFVGIQLCNSLRYKIYLSDSLKGKFYNIGDQTGNGEDHCQFVDSFLDGRTGHQLLAEQLPPRTGFYRAMRQEPVSFGEIGGRSHITYVPWYECGTPIPGKWW